MNLSITFPTEIETILRQRATALGKDIDSLVKEIVIEEVAEDSGSRSRQGTHAEFMQKLDAMIQRHGIRNGKFDDSRESIYSGRES